MSDMSSEIFEELGLLYVTGQKIGEKVGRCNHCGNSTIHLTLQIFTLDNEEDYREDLKIGYPEIDEIIKRAGRTDKLTWLIQECVTCKGLLLKEKYTIEDEEWPYRWEEFKILYPVTKPLSDNLPSPVMKAYEAALKVKPVDPSAFAVLAGRTLEAACNHEKAQGRNLAQKLEYLVKSERIPDTLVKMAQQVRSLRNLGAHDDEDVVTEEDVPIILEFLDLILEYLYVAPAKIDAVKARLEKNKNHASEHSGD